MHELSLAHGIVETANRALADSPGVRVSTVRLRVGRLSGVEPGALHFCYEVASAGTALEGSRLVIEEVPVAVWCPHCAREVELAGVQRFRCPDCDTPSGDVRRGKEIEVHALEVAA